MTREEQLDWLCRLRSEIYVYMPKEWLIPMNDALDMTIKTLEKQPCEPVPKKCHNENKDYDDCDQFVCSNCGIELQDWHQVERDKDDGIVSYHEYEFHFCPNCGAKIEGEE